MTCLKYEKNESDRMSCCLHDSVKLINFVEILSNCEAKNMTDLKAEHEIVFRGCRSRTGWRPKKKKYKNCQKCKVKNGGF